MSYHPAYPCQSDLRRERDATNRDLADRLRVSVLDAVLRRAIREIEAVSEIEHPDARFSVAEIADALHAELHHLSSLTETLSGALVLEDE